MNCRKIIIIYIICGSLLFSACGAVVRTGDRNNPVSVEYAIEKTEQYVGDSLFVKAYPVAYMREVSFIGEETFNIFFSDSEEDRVGEIDGFYEASDNWLSAHIHKDSTLYDYAINAIDGDAKLQKITIEFKVTKENGWIYTRFVDWEK